jgi:hypothetical protein
MSATGVALVARIDYPPVTAGNAPLQCPTMRRNGYLPMADHPERNAGALAPVLVALGGWLWGSEHKALCRREQAERMAPWGSESK